ncbi:MAG TPA: HD domain-containing phosphohydrolase [Gallionellaceae bacterium]
MAHKSVILAVDDTPASLKLLTDMLKEEGYEVRSAINGDLALRSAASSPPDLVLLDIRMAGMDGFEVCRRLKAEEITRSIPVIFVSAMTATEEKVRGFELGAVDFVTKPYQREELLARVRTHLELMNLRLHLEELVAERTLELGKSDAALRKLNRALKTLGDGDHALVHAREEGELMRDMCRAATDSGGYALAWAGYLHQDERKRIEPVASSGPGKDYVKTLEVTWADEPRGQGPTGSAARTGQTQVAQDIAHDPRMEPWRNEAAKYGFASSIALPLKQNGTVFGVMNIYAAEAEAFGADEIKLLEEMAGDLSFGIATLHTRNELEQAIAERQRYYNQMRAGLEKAVDAIAATLEMRDPYTAGHQRRVADLATAIARELGLPDEQVQAIHLAGTVHDLGKIHIPAEILTKPGKLSDLEYRFIKTHPQAGYDILKGIDFPWPIAHMVLQHHERLDGSGYPNRLKGDDIILEARILAVADVVEAMFSNRPYRPGLGLDAALDEITRNRGKFYDAKAVDACVKLLRENGYRLS